MRSAMRAASQLSGRGPIGVDVAPVLHLGSGPHSEGEKTTMVRTCGTLQWCSQDSL